MLLLLLSRFSSVQFISVAQSSPTLWDAMNRSTPPCPSPTPGVHSDSRPSSQWCHPAISSSVIPFSSCPQSLPASESFSMSQLFAWGGQSTRVSALASFFPKNAGNLICGSSAFSKPSLNIWKFKVHILLKPGLENFEYYFVSVWDECNCVVVWTFFGIAFLWDWNENWPFPVPWPLLSLTNLQAYWVPHLNV